MEGVKTKSRAVIIANKTTDGLSLIDIQVFGQDGRLLAHPTKQQIDDINATPYLDREGLKNMVAKQYGLLPKDVTYFH